MRTNKIGIKLGTIIMALFLVILLSLGLVLEVTERFHRIVQAMDKAAWKLREVCDMLLDQKKLGNQDKEKWIWSGVGVGVAVSLVLGVFVQMLFSSGAFGSNNFLIAGMRGLFAAIMLINMSYWLHSKASLAQWSQYISSKSTKCAPWVQFKTPPKWRFNI